MTFRALLSLHVWAGTYIAGDSDYDVDSDGDVVLDVDASAAAGDVAVIFGTMGNGSTFGALGPSSPANTTCTQVLDTGGTTGYGQSRHTINICEFTGTPPSTITMVDIIPGSARPMAALMLIYRGVDPDSYDVPAFVFDASGTIDNINHPSTTVPGSGGVVIMAGHWEDTVITPVALPSGYTMRLNVDHAGTGFPPPNTQYAASNEAVGPGASGGLNFQFSPNNAGKVLFTVSLADVGGAGGGTVVNPMTGRGGAAAVPIH